MVLKSIFRDRKRKNSTDTQKYELDHSDLQLTSGGSSSSSYPLLQQSPWASLPPELLLEIVSRVEANEITWPARKAVVSCASVCKSWREITNEVVKPPAECGLITFPMSLKQPGPRDYPIQCFIRRDRATSTYILYLGLSLALSGDASKLLLAAKKIKKATKTDILISFTANDFSQTSDNFAGKLRSNFFGSKFLIHDRQPPCNSATNQYHGWSWKRISAKKVTPKLPICNYHVATIEYELNVLRTRGPRRMHCAMHSIPFSAIQEDGFDNTFCSEEKIRNYPPGFRANRGESIGSTSEPLILKNKAPRWHDQLQCWCLNFSGRVTVASVKNFQLVAAVDPSQRIPASEQDKVILQFGKIGKDIFTMDYRYPLSAFQAFAICLCTFDTKPVCE